jgi:hypothetical protein
MGSLSPDDRGRLEGALAALEAESRARWGLSEQLERVHEALRAVLGQRLRVDEGGSLGREDELVRLYNACVSALETPASLPADLRFLRAVEDAGEVDVFLAQAQAVVRLRELEDYRLWLAVIGSRYAGGAAGTLSDWVRQADAAIYPDGLPVSPVPHDDQEFERWRRLGASGMPHDLIGRVRLLVAAETMEQWWQAPDERLEGASPWAWSRRGGAREPLVRSAMRAVDAFWGQRGDG